MSARRAATGFDRLASWKSVDVATGGTLRKRPSAQRVKCVTLSENGSIVVYGGFDKKVRLLHDSVT